jgi:hypothetical protein
VKERRETRRRGKNSTEGVKERSVRRRKRRIEVRVRREQAGEE